MKAPKVTEGEWAIGDENNQCAEVLFGSEHNLVASLDRADKNTGVFVISREEMLANAQMLAASKKLAEALNEAVRVESSDLFGPEYRQAITAWRTQARAALLAAGYTED